LFYPDGNLIELVQIPAFTDSRLLHEKMKK